MSKLKPPSKSPSDILIRIVHMSWITAILLTGFTAEATDLLKHDTPDGFVERSVAVVLRGREIVITYQIGINPKTTRDQLRHWQIEETFDSEEVLNEKFCELLQTKILAAVEIEVDGVPLETAVSNIEPFAAHHKSALVTLTAQIPSDKTEVDFALKDTAFANLEGATRFAIKARSAAIVLQSNVAPIIQRAERIELSSLTAEEKEQSQIRARLKFLDK